MKKQLVAEKFKHIYLSPPFRKMLSECMAKDKTRYAMDRVFICKNKFTVSDGQKLFAVTMRHDFEQGLYFITGDGYCLKDEQAGKFPTKWREIIPKAKDTKVVWECGATTDYITSAIAYELHRADSYFNLEMFSRPLALLMKLNPHNLKVVVSKEETESRPFMITGNLPASSTKAKFVYIQMPMRKPDANRTGETE